MKITSVLLTAAVVSMLGVSASVPSAYARGTGHYNCKGGDSYDVMKGKCIATTGATAYSPNRAMHKHHKHHKKHVMKPATTAK